MIFDCFKLYKFIYVHKNAGNIAAAERGRKELERRGIKTKDMSEGEENKSSAYQAGFNDGKKGSSDPRASSKYGPGSNDYTAGYRDGLKHEEQARKDRSEQYRASIAPYVKMSDDKLAQLESDITQRRDEIVAASRSGKSTPAMKQEYKELNDKFQAINQARFQKKNTQQNGMAEGYRILPNIDREKYQ
jgi:hypothetical protein